MKKNDKKLLYWHKYYSENKEKEALRKKKYYEENKELIVDRRKKYNKDLVKRKKRTSKYYKSEKGKALVKKFRKQNPEKVICYDRVKYAIKSGKIKKPDACSICGEKMRSRNIQAHHNDYTKPLEVIWVCATCHRNLHEQKQLVA